jgi:hypothetical protein
LGGWNDQNFRPSGKLILPLDGAVSEDLPADRRRRRESTFQSRPQQNPQLLWAASKVFIRTQRTNQRLSRVRHDGRTQSPPLLTRCVQPQTAFNFFAFAEWHS